MVQIPLWSIVTFFPGAGAKVGGCSNSSMVDSNPTQEYFCTKVNRSNSSMVDSNVCSELNFFPLFAVQIPLWSIVTLNAYYCPECYKSVQIPLWSIVTSHRTNRKTASKVQIPLWSIVTH